MLLLPAVALADDDDENVLKQIVGVGRPRDAGQTATQRRLDTAEQRFERFAIAALRPQHPLHLLDRCDHLLSCHLRGTPWSKGSKNDVSPAGRDRPGLWP